MITVKFELDKNNTTAPKYNDSNEDNNLELVKQMTESPRIKMLIEKVEGQVIGVKKRNNN